MMIESLLKPLLDFIMNCDNYFYKMSKLETLIELINLEKQNRKNRLEDKLKQQEYYGETEELFDPLTKTLNANSEHNLALSEQTLRAIDWQNQELDKQTKMIEQTRNGALMKPDFSIEAVEETQDIAPVYVDTKTAKLLHEIGAQTNPQLKVNLVDLPARRYKMNDVDIHLEQGAFLDKDNIYEFPDGFIKFLTKSNVRYYDNIEEDENKFKRFLKDIRYDLGKGDKKSARYRTIKRIMGIKDDVYGRGLNSNPNQQSCHHYVDPNSLIERLELLILETIGGHDGLYDEMLDIFKQLLSMNIINQDQLDKFVFNYGK